MASINDLKGYLSRSFGVAQANQFVVQLPSGSDIDRRQLNVLCKSVTLPGKQITTVDRTIGIFNEKVANGFLVDDVSMTFHVLNDYATKKYFDQWMANVLGFTSTDERESGSVRYKKDYGYRVSIQQLKKPILRFGFNVGPLDLDLDVGGDVIYAVDLIDAFPTSINTIQLSDELDGLVEINVQFSFTDWEVKEVKSSPIEGSTNFNFGSVI